MGKNAAKNEAIAAKKLLEKNAAKNKAISAKNLLEKNAAKNKAIAAKKLLEKNAAKHQLGKEHQFEAVMKARKKKDMFRHFLEKNTAKNKAVHILEKKQAIFRHYLEKNAAKQNAAKTSFLEKVKKHPLEKKEDVTLLEAKHIADLIDINKNNAQPIKVKQVFPRNLLGIF